MNGKTHKEPGISLYVWVSTKRLRHGKKSPFERLTK